MIQGGGQSIVGGIDGRWNGGPGLLSLVPIVQGQALFINTLHFGVGVGDDERKGLGKVGYRATIASGGVDGKDLP